MNHRNIFQSSSIHRNIFQSWLSFRNIFQSWSSHRNIFLLKSFHSFTLIFKIYSLYPFSSFTLSTVTSSIACLEAIYLDPFTDLSTLVVGPMTDLSLSVVLAGDSLKLMKFGLSATTELLLKSILFRLQMSSLSSGIFLGPTILLKMGVECPCMAVN